MSRRLVVLVTLLATVAACQPQVPVDAAPAVFAPSSMTPFADSFVIIIDGARRGWHRYAVEPTSTGWRFREAFAIGNEMSRTVDVELDSTLRLLTSNVRDQVADRQTHTRLSYEGRRVTGASLTDHRGTKREAPIDTTLPADAFDGIALMGLLWTLDWRPGAVYLLRMFDAEEANVTSQVLRISGPESLTVPAGAFEALRGDLTTTQTPVRIWVTRAKPHRLLKVGHRSDDFMTVRVSR